MIQAALQDSVRVIVAAQIVDKDIDIMLCFAPVCAEPAQILDMLHWPSMKHIAMVVAVCRDWYARMVGTRLRFKATTCAHGYNHSQHIEGCAADSSELHLEDRCGTPLAVHVERSEALHTLR